MKTVSRFLSAALLCGAGTVTAEGAAAGDPGDSAADPRIEWTALRRAGRLDELLARLDVFVEQNAAAGSLGAHYLRGTLLVDLGQLDRGAAALAAGLGSDPQLEPYIRFRLAEAEVARDHPEVAAGLLAGLLSSHAPPELSQRAAKLLALSLRRGADCRLLGSMDRWRLETPSRRLLRLRRAACARATDPGAADRELLELLADDTTDGVALEAAESLDAALDEPDGTAALDIALAFFGQRRFDKAVEFFSHALEPGSSLTLAQRRDYDTQYALARSYFWLGDHRRAAATFGDLSTLTQKRAERARALYQRGRSLELGGHRARAGTAFQEVVDVDPDGSWAAAAITSMLRLEWLAGDEGTALELYARLGRHRRWRGSWARAALFLAASDLVSGRADRARSWLEDVTSTPEIHLPEVAYWQGRLAELDADPARAVERYRVSLLDDPFDPWAQEALRRLAAPELEAWRRRAVAGLAASDRDRDLLSAWLLASPSGDGAASLERLRSRLAGRGEERAFMELAAVPTELWPLWQGSPRNAEEKLVALGDWDLGRPAVAAGFPVAEAPLAITRARFLAEQGLTRASILTAEVLVRQSPDSVPEALWPEELARLLYPMAHGALLRAEASDAGLDPKLLAALVREESRFDAGATSAAAARGLTQFVLPTARRLGDILGMGTLDADSLHRPEVALRLGAAYLAELGARFGSREHLMLAAYNAGEAQAELWRDYCFSDERAEYLTKVGFRETRNYLRKVLRSYRRYRDLYPST